MFDYYAKTLPSLEQEEQEPGNDELLELLKRKNQEAQMLRKKQSLTLQMRGRAFTKKEF